MDTLWKKNNKTLQFYSQGYVSPLHYVLAYGRLGNSGIKIIYLERPFMSKF